MGTYWAMGPIIRDALDKMSKHERASLDAALKDTTNCTWMLDEGPDNEAADEPSMDHL